MTERLQSQLPTSPVLLACPECGERTSVPPDWDPTKALCMGAVWEDGNDGHEITAFMPMADHVFVDGFEGDCAVCGNGPNTHLGDDE